ncbi:hypothetical protein [Terrimicrobium sacchariphilum]|nr:hypothetical protein [Terrimicrobium sacchariphilum]
MEFLVWVFAPIGFSIAALIVSVKCAIQGRAWAQWISLAVVASLNIYAVSTLVHMMTTPSWPSPIPHGLIGVSLLVAVAQYLAFRRTKKRGPGGGGRV